MIEESYLRQLAKQLMFELSDKEVEEAQKRFEIFEQQMELLNAIDTTNVEPMIYPFESPTTYLREDVVSSDLNQEMVLQNAPIVKEGHFVVPKVVK